MRDSVCDRRQAPPSATDALSVHRYEVRHGLGIEPNPATTAGPASRHASSLGQQTQALPRAIIHLLEAQQGALLRIEGDAAEA